MGGNQGGKQERIPICRSSIQPSTNFRELETKTGNESGSRGSFFPLPLGISPLKLGMSTLYRDPSRQDLKAQID